MKADPPSVSRSSAGSLAARRIVENRVVSLSPGQAQHRGPETGRSGGNASEQGRDIIESVHADQASGRSREMLPSSGPSTAMVSGTIEVMYSIE